MTEPADDQVVISRAEYEELLAFRAKRTRPAEVVALIRAGATPLRAWRRYRGMTQAQLAAAGGVTQGHLSELEVRGGKQGSFLTMRFLARALETSLDLL
ncbi:helix-turn-helix domain-containing protein [Caulobacter rhizosphaerae]|uniref:helix-turn-helix domain-containing protein n=1 Tax=Caulobacter rhizosphaerae TaxID=2010972 RepID=UPI0013D54C82|nr:helix-turn-helix transcriptional regulator [Caulobacter rhizosphaerae]GGL48245.1 hypothetical protein GCM10010983_52010 [Caulobacter rhizosphaerae]